MDFFEAQAAAHRTTLRLVGLFVAAVLALIVLTVALVGAILAWSEPPAGMLTLDGFLRALSPTLVLGIAGGVAGVIVIASVFRLISLSRGGRAVAETLGGRLLQPNTDDPAERRLLNVAEEMAIASGLPVPPVYLIDEDGINAFAAGYGSDDAVLGITRGALEQLDRRELQGVIGHEFSHVLNGDMRLNIRLMSVLFGILVIGLVGRGLIGGRGHGRRSTRRGGGQVALIGLGLMILGYVGTLFGNLIKAAVSRQREFLADASAVQFTRHPTGLRDALRRIGGSGAGSRVEVPGADEISHMFFSQSFRSLAGGLFATHPPLDERIRALDPSWDGEYLVGPPEAVAVETDAPDAGRSSTTTRAATGAATDAVGAILGGSIAAAGTRPGRVEPGDLDRAHQLIAGIPAPLHAAAHDPSGARALIHALLLSTDPDVRRQQLAHLAAEAEPDIGDRVAQDAGQLDDLPHELRLPLVQLAIPALKTLSETQYQRFLDNLLAMIRADASISRFEWVLHQVLLKELRPHFEGVSRRRSGQRRIEQEREACAALLSVLARAGHDEEEQARSAFAFGMRALELPETGFDPGTDPDQQALTAAMRRLRRLHPLARPRLLKAAVTTAEQDGVLRTGERDLLQGIAAALDCPLPPLSERGIDRSPA
jgi:Zn-dependent protease with chaperone function